MKKFILPFLLALSLPFATSAQTDASRGETCGLESNSQEARDFLNTILGTWTLSHQSGYVTASGMTIPYPAAGDAEQATFVREGPKLFMVDPSSGIRMPFYWAMEGDWTFGGEDLAAGLPAPTLSSDDLEMVMNCSLSEVPRLIGRDEVMVDGILMDFVYRIAVVQSGTMYGVMHVTSTSGGYPFMSRRTVVFNR